MVNVVVRTTNRSLVKAASCEGLSNLASWKSCLEKHDQYCNFSAEHVKEIHQDLAEIRHDVRFTQSSTSRKALASVSSDSLPVSQDGPGYSSRTGTIQRTNIHTNNGLYETLPFENSIRLLEILPGQRDDKIQCRLLFARLGFTCPRYEAVSYFWGNAEDQVIIMCNGRQVRVTRNLHDAVRRFRLPRIPRLIWIDGLCINQEDLNERGHQVRIMGRIYSSAESVLVWLGHPPGGHNPIVVFSTICRLADQLFQEMETSQEVRASYTLHDSSLPHFSDLWQHGLDDEHTEALLWNFYDIHWFRRSWVIQEVVLSASTRVFWGEASIPWEFVGLAALRVCSQFLRGSIQRGPQGMHCAGFMLIQGKRGDQSFLETLWSTIFHEASEPRDKVYALLGLPTKEGNPAEGFLFVEPDYTLPIQEVYAQVARKALTKNKTCELLSYVYHGPEIHADLPSWVPQWNYLSSTPLAPRLGRGISASIGLPTIKPLLSKGDRIGVMGFDVDMILEAFPTMSEESFPLFSEVKDILAAGDSLSFPCPMLYERVLSMYSTPQGRNILAWTLVNGQYSNLVGLFGVEGEENRPYEDFAAYLLPYFAAKDTCNGRTTWRASAPTNMHRLLSEVVQTRRVNEFIAAATKGDAQRYRNVASWACMRRRLFFTGDGAFGIGPETLCEGDRVCVLSDCHVPFVLRPEDGHWRLVGACYIKELMHGEAVQEWRAGGLKLREFEIW